MREDINEDLSDSGVEAQVRSLETMNLASLRAFWQARWGEPPRLRSVELLRLIIAWRVQAAEEGGLSAQVKARLRSKFMPRNPNLSAGTRLTREYRGMTYTAVVQEAGIEYAGRLYGSLSEVAREITGTHWNGPRFFGLRGGATK
ncbi:MAG: DUF2924 domain-containing protein [Devosia sp.]|nr:DUF2924 domain-containing protein [Devosia sp.]